MCQKKWEGWEQEEPTIESVQEHWLKENLNKVMTLKPKGERVSQLHPQTGDGKPTNTLVKV